MLRSTAKVDEPGGNETDYKAKEEDQDVEP